MQHPFWGDVSLRHPVPQAPPSRRSALTGGAGRRHALWIAPIPSKARGFDNIQADPPKRAVQQGETIQKQTGRLGDNTVSKEALACGDQRGTGHAECSPVPLKESREEALLRVLDPLEHLQAVILPQCMFHSRNSRSKCGHQAGVGLYVVALGSRHCLKN